MRLGGADLEAILGFLVDVNDLEFETPYPEEVLVRLQDLVPCDDLTYQEVDLPARQFLAVVGLSEGDGVDEQDRFWASGPCPITEHRVRTGDLGTVRVSDLMSLRQYHELPIYRDYFGPCGVDRMIDVGLSADPLQYRTVILFRATGARDFSERDRAVLEMLRPHFHALENRAAMRRRLAELGDLGTDHDTSHLRDPLTVREREIVQLVSQGNTNAQIAALLWISPGTVKKHLENVYDKLGVGRRAAAAARLYLHN